MTIYFNAAKDPAKPNYLSVKTDKTGERDCIHLTEMIWAFSETKITFLGILGDQCSGIEEYGNKFFSPVGQKVCFSFLRDENYVKDKESGQNKSEPASDEQKLIFHLAQKAIVFAEHNNAVMASAIIKPSVGSIACECFMSGKEEDKPMLDRLTKGLFTFNPCQPNLLTPADTEFIKTSNQQKPGELKKGGGNYIPPETQAEILKARWEFIDSQFAKFKSEMPFEDMPTLILGISFQEDSLKDAYFKALDAMLKMMGGSK